MGKEKSDLWMAISIGICMGLGYAIDHYVGTHPWGVLLGGLIGGFLGLYGVIRQCM